MNIVKRPRMNTWIASVMVVLLAGCASKRAVPVDCERRLSPINVPAVIADPLPGEAEMPEGSES